MSRPVLSSLILTALIMASVPLAPVASAAESNALCGVVLNAAGWPVAGATVFVGIAASSAITFGINQQAGFTATTREDGTFEVPTLAGEGIEHTLLVVAPVDGPARYEPFQGSVTPYDLTSTSCPAGTAGKRYDITLEAPQQTLLSIHVKDLLANKSLAGATVALGAGLAVSDANGIARIGCPTTTSGGTLAVSAPGFVASLQQVSCTAENAAASHNLTMWRKPLQLVTTVTRDPLAASGLELPAEGARVTLGNFPAELVELDPLATDCFDSSASAGAQGLIDAPAAAPLDPSSPYVCSATTTATGVAVLRVPWSTTGTYTLVALSPGYVATKVTSVSLADTEPGAPTGPQGLPARVSPDGQDTTVIAPATRTVRLNLQASESLLTQAVTDEDGAPVEGVNVRFSGAAIAQTTTDDEGNFSVSVPPGYYTVTLEAVGLAPRTCALAIEADADELRVRAGSLEPTYCWTLLPDGNAVLRGRVVDAETGIPIGSASACILPANCTTTTAQGAFSLAVNTSGGYDLSVGKGTAWPAVAAARAAEAEGSFIELGDVRVARANRCVRIAPTFGGAAVTDADVTVTRAGALIASGASGASGLSLSLPWTTGEDAAFNTAAYAVSMRRDSAQPWLATLSTTLAIPSSGAGCATPLASALVAEPLVPVVVSVTSDNISLPVSANVAAAPSSRTAVCGNCSATVAPGGTATLWLGTEHTYYVCASAIRYNETCVERWTPAQSLTLNMPNHYPAITVNVRDAHTGELVTARVTATSIASTGTPPCTEISETCESTGAPVVLRLRAGVYRICVTDIGAMYEARCNMSGTSISNTIVKTGSDTVNIHVPRTYVDFPTFRAVDAHTNAPLQGAILKAVVPAGFTCAPAGFTFDCESGATANTGLTGTTAAPAMRVPVGVDICWAVDGIAYGIEAEASSANVVQNDQDDVGPAARCDDLAAMANGTAIEVRMLRAPMVLNGTIASALDGSVPEGARITASLRRASLAGTGATQLPAFECDAETNASTLRYKDCFGVTPAENGSFAMTLPLPGSLPHVWTVTVSAPGYFTETIENVPDGADLGLIEMQPTSFTLNVTVAFQHPDGTTGGCGTGRIVGDVKDLEVQGGAKRLIIDTAKGCSGEVVIDTWNHVGFRVFGAPAAVPQRDTNAFLVAITDPSRALTAEVVEAGPSQDHVTVRAVDPNTQPPSAEVQTRQLTGMLTDADRALVGLPGESAGVLGLVVATRVSGPCYGAADTVANTSLPTGAFELTLPCPGTYSITVVPLGSTPSGSALPGVPLYSAPAARVVDATSPPAPVTIPMQRVRVAAIWAIVVDPSDATSSPNGVNVRVTGVDNGANQTAQVTNYLATTTLLPWGVYRVAPVTPAGTALAGALGSPAGPLGEATGSVVTLGVPSNTPPTLAVVVLASPSGE